MSAEYLTRAWRMSLPPTEKLALIYFADVWNEPMGFAEFDFEQFAEFLGVGESSAVGVLNSLQDRLLCAFQRDRISDQAVWFFYLPPVDILGQSS